MVSSTLLPPLFHDMLHAMQPHPSTLHNCNRVTNKTRLKVIRDTIEADSVVLDEDEEKARVVSTAGVDAEDANVRFFTVLCSLWATMLVAWVWRVLIGWNRGNFVPRNADSPLSPSYLGTSFASSPLGCRVSASGDSQYAVRRREGERAGCLHPNARQHRRSEQL